MCRAYLWCLLLVCFPGELYTQSAAQSCPAPSLDGGYLNPEQDTYNHGEKLTYSCDNTHKPAVEGWWAGSTCRNGIWIPEPRCIDQKACLPLKIKNAQYTENSKGWYEDGSRIRIKCDEGYEALNQYATAVCLNGAWTSVPVCQLRTDACRAPPKIPHAVFLGMEYKEVFAAGSVLQYECKKGTIEEGEESTKNITCLSGNWTDGPTCFRNCGVRPNVTEGIVMQGDDWSLEYKCNRFYTLVGPGTVWCYRNGSWSQTPTCEATYCTLNTTDLEDLVPDGVKYLENGQQESFRCKDVYPPETFSVATCTNKTLTRTKCKIPATEYGPTGGGHSSSAGSELQRVPVRNCGTRPQIRHGEVVIDDEWFLEYHCNEFYSLVGPDTVKCYSDGSWSQIPTCADTYCSLNTNDFEDLVPVGVVFFKHGEKKTLRCTDVHYFDQFSVAKCTNKTLTRKECMNRLQIQIWGSSMNHELYHRQEDSAASGSILH